MKKRIYVLVAIFLFSSGSFALAAQDPFAGCDKSVREDDFNSGKTKLVEISSPDLSHLPKGFAADCRGSIDFTAVVKPDGSTTIAGIDHGLLCGRTQADFEKGLDDELWRRSILMPLLTSMRFDPPKMDGRAVCVVIHRGWIPEYPKMFWSPEEWAHRK